MAKIATTQQAKNSSAKRSFGGPSGEAVSEIERLAYQFFVERGFQHGHHEQDWLRAEAIVKKQKRL